MNELFRFMTVRGPQAANADANIPLTGSQGTTPFQDVLRPLRGTPGVFEAMAEKARQYEASEEFVAKLADLPLGTNLETLYRWLVELLTPPPPPPQSLEQDISILAQIAARIVQIFDQSAAYLAESSTLAHTRERVHDSLIALFLAPATGRSAPQPVPLQQVEPSLTPPLRQEVSMAPLAAVARAIEVILRVASADTALNDPTELNAAVNQTLLLPPTIFPLLPEPRIRPAGVADLRVVRQQLTRYEAGEVSDIQNILAGESRKHSKKHTLTVEHTVIRETENTTESSKDLSTKERFALKQEIEKTLKEETNVTAGLSISAKFGKTLALNTNVDVAYDNSKDSAQKTASSFAKEVTYRAASKVTERIRTQEISNTIETFLDQQDHSFENPGPAHIRGVYQWLNKIYTAQVFNYGKRLLFDISVPEPAAFLLDTGFVAAAAKKPVPPIPFTLNGIDGAPLRPVHLSADPGDTNYYLKIAARYGVEAIEPPPPAQITWSQVLSPSDATPDNSRNLLDMALDKVKIPDGYAATTVRVNGSYTQKNGTSPGPAVFDLDSSITLYVGSVALNFVQGKYGLPDQEPLTDPKYSMNTAQFSLSSFPVEIEQIAMSLSTWNVQGLGLTIELVCNRTAAAFEIWQLHSFDTVMRAYQQQLSDYRERFAQFLDFEQGDPNGATALGGNPDHNRAIERRELKKSALEILAAKNLVNLDRSALVASPPNGQTRNFPRLDLNKVERQGAIARFFEQAFEWEEMTYFFYPYYWGRTSTWYEKALMTHDDPLFLEFLKAGAARVVVPVRPGFESDVQYYLMTGQVWGGGELPGLTDSDYLPITEEIREVTGAPGKEQPEGESWEVTLPTQLVKLREQDGSLPAWKQDPVQGWKLWVDDPPKHITSQT